MFNNSSSQALANGRFVPGWPVIKLGLDSFPLQFENDCPSCTQILIKLLYTQ